jgi:ribosomal-protein-alanine N-acetyltransferase
MRNVKLLRAVEPEAEVIENLIPFYIYDLSEHMGWRCPESGRFGGQDDLPQYWGRPVEPAYSWPDGSEGYPFIIRADDELAGFALVKRVGNTSPPHFEVGGFFVLRKFRRQHLGAHVAHEIFAMFPGEWTVGSMVGNTPANRFWAATVQTYTSGNCRTSEGQDEPWDIDLMYHHFTSNGAANKPGGR